jgi:hypothetical protein
MRAETLAAVAAVAAAAISLINVGITAYFAHRQESVKWIRQKLPELVREFTDAAFVSEREIFESDWRKFDDEQMHKIGVEAYRKARETLERLEVFANPRTISTANAVVASIEKIRVTSIYLLRRGEFEIWHDERRPTYWAYAEA